MSIDKSYTISSDNKKKNAKIIIYIFVALEFVLYISFLYLDFSKNNSSLSSAIKYISILICLLFVFFPVKKRSNLENTSTYDSKDILLLRLALTFTFISDYFLLFTSEIIAGLLSFILVQLLYLVRIYNWKQDASLISKSKNPLYLYFLPNIVITILILIPSFMFLKNINLDIMLTITLVAFYFISLIINSISVLKISLKTRSKRAKIFAIGLLLFVLCDINVGLFNLTYYIPINPFLYKKIHDITSVSMWLFYLPSQVLISLSKYTQKS